MVIQSDDKGQFKQGYGTFYKDLARDLETPEVFWEQNTNSVTHDFFESRQVPQENILSSSVQRIIFIDDLNKAHFAFKVEWLSATQGPGTVVSKTISILDEELSLLAEFDGLFQAALEGGSGPSGNFKVPRTDFAKSGFDTTGATDPTTFVVNVDQDTCYFDAQDVETRDTQQATTPALQSFSYDCTDGTNYNDNRPTNLAESPLNDAHYHAQVVQRMYQEYLGNKVYGNQKIIQHVHYGQQMDQAFYNDGQVYYGDGGFLFYPMVSLDLVAHEVSHGFTHEWGSSSKKLMLSGQALAINESFSDISGEAAEFFLHGSNDWKVGFEIYKLDPAGSLRYLDQPTNDGVSVDHIDDWEPSVSGHHSAGIFSKAFYSLVTEPVHATETSPWNTKYAFILFADANKNCWTANSNFEDAAACVMDSVDSVFANRLQAEGATKADGSAWQGSELKNHVRKAFGQVGIMLQVGSGLESEFTHSTRFLEVTFDNTSRNNGQIPQSALPGYSWLWDFGDANIANSTAFEPTAVYSAPGQYLAKLTATAPDGPEDSYQLTVDTWDDYCAVSGGSIDRYYIDSVSINGVTKNSTGSVYSDFTTPSVDVFEGSPFDVNVSAGLPASTASNNKRFYIWLDRNQDGLFKGSEELAFSGSAVEAINTQLSVTGEPGTVIRMRVIASFGSLSNACGSFAFGEAEDYSLKILDSSIAPVLNISPQPITNAIRFENTTNDNRIASWDWQFE